MEAFPVRRKRVKEFLTNEPIEEGGDKNSEDFINYFIHNRYYKPLKGGECIC